MLLTTSDETQDFSPLQMMIGIEEQETHTNIYRMRWSETHSARPIYTGCAGPKEREGDSVDVGTTARQSGGSFERPEAATPAGAGKPEATAGKRGREPVQGRAGEDETS